MSTNAAAGDEPTAADKPPDRPAPRRPTSPYRELWRSSRRRPWVVRILIAVAASSPFFVLLGWQPGLAVMVLAGLADAAYRSQTSSSVPSWRALGSAERMTEQQLRRMRSKDFRVLHNRAIPDSEASIDHLIAGPTGVFAIDSERWRRELPIRSYLNKLYLGPFPKQGRLDEALWEANRASELIGEHLDREVNVIPSLAVYGPKIPWKFLNVRGVDVFTGRRACAWLRRRPRVMSQIEVERIVRAAEQVLPARQ